jgi:hypothetical protein
MDCHCVDVKKVECLHPPTSVDLVVANARGIGTVVVTGRRRNRHVDTTLLTQMLNSATHQRDLTRYRSATVHRSRQPSASQHDLPAEEQLSW